MKLSMFLVLFSLLFVSCGEDPEEDANNSYSFTSTASTTITTDSLSRMSSKISQASSRANTFCSSVFCVTPTSVSGKYYAIGLSIQAGGSGMSATFGDTAWSDITAASLAFDFSLNTPFTNSEPLFCCNGTGDLSSDNTYIESVSYLMAYIDVTFTLTEETHGVHGSAIGTHTIRFILANDAVVGALRGDLMYKDSDDTLKWMNSVDGTLSTTRPASPVVLDDAIVNYTNPFGTEGNQSIPVIYAGLKNETSGLFTVTEDELRADGKTYEFFFNAADLIIFPSIIKDQDEGMISTRQILLSKIHLQGLPFTGTGLTIGTTPSAPDTTLIVTP